MSTVVTEGRVGTVSPGLWDGTSGEDPVLAQAVCAKGEGACGGLHLTARPLVRADSSVAFGDRLT